MYFLQTGSFICKLGRINCRKKIKPAVTVVIICYFLKKRLEKLSDFKEVRVIFKTHYIFSPP